MIDDENNPITISYTPTTHSFIALSTDKTTFTFSPVGSDFSLVGTVTITITLSDT